MNTPFETVQVELVNSWWSQLIPVAALFISLFAVGLTLSFRYMDRLQLNVGVIWMPVLTSKMQPFTGQDRITIQVTNKSRTATTEITALLLETNEKKSLGANGPSWSLDSELPVSTGPGQKAFISYSAKSLGAVLTNQGQAVEWVQGMAISGHKTVKGKKHRDIVRKLRDYGREHTFTR